MASSNLPANTPTRTPSRPAPSGPPARPSGGGGGGGGGVNIDPVRIALTYWPLVAAAGFVSVVVGIGAYIALGQFAPRYESESAYEVLARPSADSGGIEINATEIEKYMGTQVAVIESDRILSAAIDTNEVRQQTEWIKQFVDGTGGIDVRAALKNLRDMVEARAADDARVIVLRVSAPNPSDAAVIARAIQERYVADNRQANLGDVTSRLQDIEARIVSTRAAIESVEQQVQALTRAETVEGFNEQGTAAAQEIRNLQPTLVDTRASLASARETLEQRERLLGGEGVALDPNSTPVGFVFPETTRATAEQSPIIRNFDLRIAGLEADLQALGRTYGSRNSAIRRIEDQLAGLRDRRDEELQSQMMNFFNTELESLRNAIPTLERAERELNEDLEEARRRQNEAAIVLQELDNLENERNRFAATLDNLDDKRTDLQLISERAGRIRVIQQPEPPDSRAFPQPVPIVGASVVLITGFVVALIVLKELREQRVRTPQDIASIPRTRVLGVLPDESMDPARPERLDRACLDAPEGAIAESVRQLRATLVQRMDERGHVSVLVGSGMPGSGATTLVANLAQSIASTGRRVLVVDANLRRPKMHEVFDLPEAPGLAEVLRDRQEFDKVVHSGVLGVDEISVLTAGDERKQAYERFQSDRMERLLEEVRGKYDAVLIDVAPGVVSSDMNTLGSYVDAAMLVVRAYAEKRGLVARLRNQLAVTGSEFLGVVVNGVKPAAGGYMKRNFAQTMSYHQPKRVENTATPAKQPKKLRGADTDKATTGSGQDEES